MNRIYVLIYIGYTGKPESWVRSTCMEIVDCLQDFMFTDEYPDVGIFLETLDSTESVDLTKKLLVNKIKTDCWPDEVLKNKINIIASKLDKKHTNASIDDIDIFMCHSCYCYTRSDMCNLCGTKTKDIED